MENKSNLENCKKYDNCVGCKYLSKSDVLYEDVEGKQTRRTVTICEYNIDDEIYPDDEDGWDYTDEERAELGL